MLCAARQNPVCATFYIHRRNRHAGSFNNQKVVRTMMREITETSLNMIFIT